MSTLYLILIKIGNKLEKLFKIASVILSFEVNDTAMNNRNKKLVLLTAALLTLSLIVGGLYIASAESVEHVDEDSNPPFRGPFGWRKPGGLWNFLNEEQRTELKEAIQALREEGSSLEDIREYIMNYLEEIGIEPVWPEVNGFGAFRPDLSEEQLEAWEQLRSDVQEYAEKRAGELGIELPPNGFLFPRMGRRARWGAGICLPKRGGS